MPELRGESDTSIFFLLAPSLYGYLMLVVCPHQKNLIVCTLCTCVHMSVSNCGHPLSLWSFLVAQMVKNMPAMQQTQVQFLGRKDPLEKERATLSSILAWKIPWTEEPGGITKSWT